MDSKTLNKMLKLAVNPHATTAQLQAGLDFIMADIEADNKYRAANPLPPQPVLTDAERAAKARRAANANLVKLRRR